MRATHAHKLTAQALWCMLIPSIVRFCEKSNEDLARKIEDLQSSSESPVEELIITVQSSCGTCSKDSKHEDMDDGRNNGE